MLVTLTYMAYETMSIVHNGVRADKPGNSDTARQRVQGVVLTMPNLVNDTICEYALLFVLAGLGEPIGMLRENSP